LGERRSPKLKRIRFEGYRSCERAELEQIFRDDISTRRWRSGLKRTMRYLCRVHGEKVGEVLHWLRESIQYYYGDHEFKIDYGNGLVIILIWADNTTSEGHFLIITP
jgi:hypothetical protein